MALVSFIKQSHHLCNIVVRLVWQYTWAKGVACHTLAIWYILMHKILTRRVPLNNLETLLEIDLCQIEVVQNA